MLVNRLAPMLVGLAFIVYAFFRLIKACIYYRKVISSRNWLETTGTVVYADIRKIHLKFLDDWNKRGYHYLTEFVYSYTVFGSRYFGEFKIDPFWGTAASADVNNAKHSPGSMLPVHYNPLKPEECVTHYTEATILDWFVTLGCLLIGVLFLLASFM